MGWQEEARADRTPHHPAGGLASDIRAPLLSAK